MFDLDTVDSAVSPFSFLLLPIFVPGLMHNAERRHPAHVNHAILYLSGLSS